MLLVFVATMTAQPLRADDTATYTYLQFSGNGRCALLDTDGALSVSTDLAEDAPSATGYQWTLESTTVDGVTNPVLLKSKLGNYVKYDETTATFSLTATASEATAFVQTTNSYYNTNVTGSTRYNLTLASMSSSTSTANTLGVKNGQLLLVKANSRYAVVRQAAAIKGAALCPLLSSDTEQHKYGWVLTMNGTEFVYDDTSVNLLSKSTAHTTESYNWCLYEANDLGDVYIKSNGGRYVYRESGSYLQLSSDETKCKNYGVYRLYEGDDNSNSTLASNWVFYNTKTTKYILPYGSGNSRVGFGSNLQAAEALYFTTPITDVWNGKTQYIQFTAQGAALLHDAGTTTGVELKERTESEDLASYQWTLEANGPAYLLKSGNGNYLKYSNSAFSLTTTKSEATSFVLQTNTYAAHSGATRYDLCLSSNTNQRLSCKGGELCLATQSCLYSVVRLASDISEVKGVAAPSISSSIENLDHVYKIKFKANSTADEALYLTANGSTFTSETKITPISSTQNWALIPAQHSSCKDGDFYLVNEEGKYFVYDNGKFQWYTTFNVSSVTAFRLLEDDTNPEHWYITMALSSNDSRTVGLSSTANTLSVTAFSDAYNALSFEASSFTDITSYIQFSGMGTWALRDNHGGELEAQKYASSNSDADFQWTLKATGVVNRFQLKSGNGRYVKYNDVINAFITTKDSTQATTFQRIKSTYAAASARYNLVLSTDNSNALCVSEKGKVYLGAAQTRFATLRLASNVMGPEMVTLSTDDNAVHYVMHHVLDNVNFACTEASGKLHKRFNNNANTLTAWTFEKANDLGDVYMRNWLGSYIQYTGGYYQVTSDKANATILRLEEFVDNGSDYTSNWQLHPYNQSGYTYMNRQETYYLKGWSGGNDTNNRMTFSQVDYSTYVMFPAMGSKVLMQTNAEHTDAPCARTVAGNDVANTYMWQFINGHLKNDAGNYLTYDADTETFGITTDASAAYAFSGASVNTYETNNAPRFNLLNTAGDKALCMNINGNLSWGESNTRYSVVKLTNYPAAPTLPVISTSGSNYQLYYLRKDDSNANSLAISTDTDGNVSVKLATADDDDINQVWLAVTDDNCTNGDCYLENVHTKTYLHYDTSTSSFTMVATKDEASKVRLTEADDNYDAWQIQLPDVSGNNFINFNELSLNPTGYGNNFFRFIKADFTPEFYTKDNGYWRYLQLGELDNVPMLKGNDTSVEVENTPSALSPSAPILWRNIGTDKDFVLLNGENMRYLKAADDGSVSLVESVDEASHFFLWFNHSTASGTPMWCIGALNADGTVPSIPGLCLGLDTDGSTLKMLDYSTIYLADTSDHHLCFSLSDPVSPPFTNSDTDTPYYVYISFDKRNANSYCTGGGSDGGNRVYVQALNKHINDMYWTLQGRMSDFTLRTKDHKYLRFDITSSTLKATLDASDASHFKAAYDTSSGRYLIQPVSGTDLTNYVDGTWYLGVSGSGENLTLLQNTSARTYILFTPAQVFNGEDYTDYAVRPKRSWFVKQASGCTNTIPTGFIQPDENGFETNAYTGKTEQKVNTYNVTHYLKAGTNRTMVLPSCLYSGNGNDTNQRAYQRWYNYSTGDPVSDDLLLFSGKSIRKYQNGLVMGAGLNFNNAYGTFVGKDFTFQMPEEIADDYEYELGIDATTYTDFVDYFGDNGNPQFNGSTINDNVVPENQDLIEPTLSSRNVFTIRNARSIANELLNCKDGSDKWYEEHTIHFPKKKITLGCSSFSLNMQFQDYWYYNAATASEENLQSSELNGQMVIEVDDEGSGITSAGALSAKTSGMRRFIAFNYPGDTNGTGTGEATSDHCVFKIYGTASDGTRYQIAKVNLYFDEETEPLIYNEVIGLNTDGSFKTKRAPESLKENVGAPVASINFNPTTYDNFITPPVGKNYSFNTGQQGPSTSNPLTYRYPLLFENSNYAFAPVAGAFNSTGATAENTWGSYAITHRFQNGDGNGIVRANNVSVMKLYEQAYGSEQYDASNSAFLYIDASDLPGRIASLEFDGSPCPASRLFVSAWVYSANNRDGNESPAQVLFNVVGVTSAGKEVILYSFCPGVIYNSARNSAGTEVKPTTTDRTPLWQQVYFSFINSSAESFVNYKLNIENACTNTAGGDILIDNVEVFAFNTSVELERTTPVCDQQITLTKMSTDFDAIMQQLGLEEDEDPTIGTPQMWYCLLDKNIFDAEMSTLSADNAGSINKQQVTQAMLKSLIGDPNTTENYRRAFRYVNFTTHYNDDTLLPTFNYKDALAVTTGTRFKETTSDGVRHFVVSDKMQGSGLKANHWYYLIFAPRYSTEPITTSNAVDAFNLDNSCRIMSAFKSAKAISVVQDGDGQMNVDGATQACAGKSVALSVKLNGSDTTTGDVPLQMFQYDWWRDYVGGTFENMVMSSVDGSVRELSTGETAAANEISLREALQNFRHFYPKATTTQGATPQADEAYSLDQYVIDGLYALTQSNGSQIAPLALLNNTCNVYVPSTTPQGQELVVTLIPIDDVTATPGVQYCFDPQHLSIQVSGKAPELYDGISGTGVSYPERITNVPVRSSLSAIEEVRETTAGTAPTNRLRLPLRGIKTITDGATGLKMVSTDDSGVASVYLAGTNDPNMKVYDEDTDGNIVNFHQVGTVTALEALTADADNAHADLYFAADFTPREGYTYNLRIDYKERFADGSITVSTTCDGTLLTDLIIVPAYQVWTGAAGNNEWTNDKNWLRADRTDLQLTAADTYTTNDANGTAQGYVPMVHTSVVIPTGCSNYPTLYATATSADSFVEFTNHEDDNRTATNDIEYCLLAEQTATSGLNTCQRYTPYTANDLVLAPAAEVAGTHLLSYRKAWMEYSLTPNRWYTLGSPLQATYAGDWYAPTDNGQQLTPYFADVTFNTTSYNRFSPAVYQRSWDVADAKLYYLDPYSATSPQESAVKDDRNVYVGANWSKVYNNVQVPYSNGGFSVKVGGTSYNGTTYTATRFRLPKEDAQFSYYTEQNVTDGKTYTVDRTNAHRLLTDNMSADQFTLTLHNNVAANAYFLVGNPFTCGLNMAKFFEKNAAVVDGAKYWLLTANGQTGVMQNSDDTGWTAINSATTSTSLGTLAPGQGFFVKAASATGSLSLTFTPEMMAQAKEVNSLLRAPSRKGRTHSAQPQQTLRIRATRGGETTEALVLKTDSASNAFQTAEDMETLVDNSQLSAPTVYTLAGHTVSSINRRRTMQRIPVGVLSDNEQPVRLTFTGMHTFTETLSLLDASNGSVTPLTLGCTPEADSVTVEVPGVTTGRYYILTSDTTPNPEDEITDEAPLVQVVGQKAVITSPTAHPLTYVHIVDAEGRTLYTMSPYTSSLTLKLSTGLYVVEAQTDTQRTVAKITVQ